ncbi:Guanylate kinase [uncultured Roseburia sp.]|uniref:Guanylate kinase n=1 Tax=Brotonthovivens ammoniilytica TaxID=2981725 RepID=A0ABT2THP9_9FIRM|nr:guanylate kinase [Brotonthovivens ammoniilytica]MCU6761725.1 guanylate kinase [Brotonthovivens ammoniilytica]SCI44663.1 Guanylate kinase [uncultured Roseburia sp.]
MGKVFCLMGKSASGKDTIYKELLKPADLKLKCVVPYTTRPIRMGETEGKDYFFCDEQYVRQMEKEGHIIELRAYETVHGVWKYFTADDGQIDLKSPFHYLMIGTLEAYTKIRDYFGKEYVIPLYIDLDDGVRLQRALDREMQQIQPRYAEMCRRFLADEKDFSDENRKTAGILVTFENQSLKDTVKEISEYIKGVC